MAELSVSITRRELLYFLKQVYIQQNGHWAWQGERSHDGYSKTYFRKEMLLAHRLAHAIYNGPIPEGMEVDHTCFVTWCVNPAHLEIVTPKENIKRAFDARLFCQNGHPFDIDNTYRYIKEDGTFRQRICKKCRTTRRQAWRAMRKEKGLSYG